MCYFEIDIQDNSVVDKLITTENWINVRDGERMTHFSFSRAYNGSEHLCLKRCMFESVTLFLSDERHYSFGDVNPCKQVKFQIIHRNSTLCTQLFISFESFNFRFAFSF